MKIKKKLRNPNYDFHLYGNVKYFYENYYFNMPFNPKKNKFSKIVHKKMELPLANKNSIDILLELGSGNGEHFKVSNLKPNLYIEGDILNHKKEDARNFIQFDATKIPIIDSSVDAVLVTCLIAHMKSLEETLSEWRRVVKSKGTLVFYVPSEPGLALSFIRKFWTARQAKKLGFEGYNLYIARDHINSYTNIFEISKFVFRHDKFIVHKYPFKFLPWWLNLFSVFEVEITK